MSTGFVSNLYHSVDEGLKHEIQRTILRLPDEVATFAVERCHFTAVGSGTVGLVLPGRVGTHPADQEISRRFVIVLLDDPVRYGEEIQSTIAHEIAHAWRGEHVLAAGHPPDAEEQTAALARSWGFTGEASNPENFRVPQINDDTSS